METQINKKDIHKWVKALRSGKYKQGRWELNPDKNTYCCLGVACENFIPKNKLKLDKITKTLIGSIPSDQEYAPQWLQNINSLFQDKTKVPLSHINDNGVDDNVQSLEPFTFDEIADLLELVFIYEILD